MNLTIGKRIILVVTVTLTFFILNYVLMELFVFFPLGDASNMTPEKISSIISKGQGIILISFLVGVIGSIITAVISIRIISAQLTGLAERLTNTTKEVSSASMELATASNNLAEASNEQASSIEETSASLEQMTGMVENNVENAAKSNKITEDVQTMSQTGNEAMINLIESMKEIEKSNENIQELVKVIAEIGQKTAVIDEIVFQTKLLSFNASVEAERAGEHGRGFAVVAQEVGNLAQMSGKAALEISNIVKDSVKTAETITSDNKSKVEKGSNLVHESAETLKGINTKAKEVANFSSQIYQASKEQSMGIRQINEAVSQLDKATQGNAAISEEQAISSRDLNGQSSKLLSVANDLKELISGNGVLSAVSVPKKTVVTKKEKLFTRPVSSRPKSAPAKKVVTPVKRTTTSKVIEKKPIDEATRPVKSRPIQEPILKIQTTVEDTKHDNTDAWEKL